MSRFLSRFCDLLVFMGDEANAPRQSGCTDDPSQCFQAIQVAHNGRPTDICTLSDLAYAWCDTMRLDVIVNELIDRLRRRYRVFTHALWIKIPVQRRGLLSYPPFNKRG